MQEQKIRARVDSPLGTVSTPHVLSFYVNKSRNQLDSFNCSLKIMGQPSAGGGVGTVTISAGVGSPTKIYEGYVTSVSVRPCFEDPDYSIVDLSGTDARKFLEGRVVTRRQIDSEKSWVEITSVNRRGIKSSKLQYNNKSDYSTMSFPNLDHDALDRMKMSAADYLNKEAKINVDDTGKRGFLDFRVIYEPK